MDKSGGKVGVASRSSHLWQRRPRAALTCGRLREPRTAASRSPPASRGAEPRGRRRSGGMDPWWVPGERGSQLTRLGAAVTAGLKLRRDSDLIRFNPCSDDPSSWTDSRSKRQGEVGEVGHFKQKANSKITFYCSHVRILPTVKITVLY